MEHNVEQRSEEWHALRLGKVTASRVADVITKTKTGWASSRANYMAELVAERLTGQHTESYVNAAMQRGVDLEAEARQTYEFFTNQTVEEIGFVSHNSIADAGASPDGLVGTDGLVEIKVPNTSTHIETLLGAGIPSKYVTQIYWQMACTGRAWCDFVSFDPRMPVAMQLFVKRIERDDSEIAKLEAAVADFLAETGAKLSALRSRYAGEPNEGLRQQLVASLGEQEKLEA